MSHFGCRCVGEKALEHKAQTLNYHWADRHNRMYFCGCIRSIRLGKSTKGCFSNRYKLTGMMSLRRYR